MGDTKWSDGSLTARDACEQSLRKLGITHVDLYVIHHSWTCNGDFVGAWRQMEELQRLGYAKSIGLSASVVSVGIVLSLTDSRFGLAEVREIIGSCKVVPAVNMIMLNPTTLAEMSPLLQPPSWRGGLRAAACSRA
jgi:diketogulonate reductase-like aldo/keto reductase